MSDCVHGLNPSKTLFKDKVFPAIGTSNERTVSQWHCKPGLKLLKRKFPAIYASSSTMSTPQPHKRSPIDILSQQGPHNEEILRAIKGSLSNCLSETNLHLTVQGLKSKTRGKV